MSDLILPLVTTVPLSLATYAYTRTIIPIYGAVPTNHHFLSFFVPAFFLGSLSPVFLSYSPPLRVKFLINAVALALAPRATYWIAVWTARWRWAVVGPGVTHILVLVPLVWSFAWLGESSETGDIALLVALPSACYLLTTWLQTQWVGMSWLASVSDTEIFLPLSFLSALAFVFMLRPASRPVKPSAKKRDGPPKIIKHARPYTRTQLVSLAVLPIFYYISFTALSSPVLPHPLPAPHTNPSYPMRVLSSVQSNTGLILVGQALTGPKTSAPEDIKVHSVRYLRADHSLLGGVWIDDLVHVIVGVGRDGYVAPLRDSNGTRLGDSIYGVFVLQEAARLAGEATNALVIGLGTGISTTSLIRHGIPTTIIEIDPAVYDAARTYFALPDPVVGFGPKGIGKGGAVHLEDARGWVATQAKQPSQLYDLIIHDCFSGGGVPEKLYTIEFWRELKKISNPEHGVLVVNFVGRVISRSSNMILYTLERTFCDGANCCRAFHDHADELTADKYRTEFLNIVFFCPTSGGRDPLKFREATSVDYLNSPLRAHILGKLDTREVDLSRVRTWFSNQLSSFPYWDEDHLLTDERNPLGKLQQDQGHFHWNLMRDVLSDVYWETF